MEKPDYILAAAQMAPVKADIDLNIRKHLELTDLTDREGVLVIHKGEERWYKKTYL